MTGIAEKLEMNKSAVHRHLATLERKRFVQRDPVTGVYQLGVRLLQMAYLVLGQSDLRRVAAPFLRDLRDQYRETVNLAVLDGTDMVYLDVVESPQRVKLAATVGQRLPAYSTASGKAVLALAPDSIVQRTLDAGIPISTEHTLRTPEAFLSDLRQTRERGFALAVQEFEEGINAVAAPIQGQGKELLAAVSIAGPSFRLTRERMVEIGPAVAAAGRAIAQELELARPL